MRPEILMHPNIPKPLHGINPRTILGSKWWDCQRKTAYEKYFYHCWACGIDKSEAKYYHRLEAHECYEFDYPKGTARMVEIVALCHSCHSFIHSGKMIMDLESGKITQEKFDDIMSHGERLIEKTSSKNPYIVNDNGFADWGDWRLIVNGNEYRSKFKTIEEWREYYAK